MGVLSNLGTAATNTAKSPAFRDRAKALAKSAAVGTAKKAWNWSGASDIPALQSAADAAGKVFGSKEKLTAGGQNTRPSMENSSPLASIPSTPPLALPPPAPPLSLPSPPEKKAPTQKTSVNERRQMSEETKKKISVANKANADQRAETRRLSSQQKGTISDAKIKSETNRAAGDARKSTALQTAMAEDIHFIASKMKEDGSLSMTPFGKREKANPSGGGNGDKGGGFLSGLAETAMGAAGGGLLGKALKYGAKIPGVSKAAELASKVPFLGKLIGAGAATTVAGSVAGEAATKTGAKAAGEVAAKAGGEAVSKVGAEAAAKTGAKAAGKSLIKKIPLIGLLASAGFATDRAIGGDLAGAGMELASGVAGTLPGVGTAASIGIDAALAARDYRNEKDSTSVEKGIAAGAIAPVDKAPANSLVPPTIPSVTPPQPPTEATPVVYNSPLRRNTTGPLTPAPTVITSPTRQGMSPPVAVRQAALPASVVPSSAAVIAPMSRDGAPIKPIAELGVDSSPKSVSMDNRAVDLLTALVTNMLDESKGIFVRPVKDVFDSEPVSAFETKPPIGLSDSRGNAVLDGSGQPVSSGMEASPARTMGLTPTANPSSVKVAPLAGSGFTPNSERGTAPRPFLGGDAVPMPRQDISKATAKDSSLAMATPMGPTVGVSMPKKGKKFEGFGGDVDSYISEASSKYGIDEKVLRGFVKMEAGYTGAMSPTGAIGTGQFIQPTWDGLAKTKEGQEIGMKKIGGDFRKASDPRFDKKTNTLATGLLAKQNADALAKAGLPPTGENLYMMHNIGPGVIPALKGQPVSESTMLAMRQNGMKEGQSATDFVAMQKGNFNKHYESANADGVKSNGSGTAFAGINPAMAPMPTMTAKAPVMAPMPTMTAKAPATPQAVVAQASTSSIAPNSDSPSIRRPAVTQQMQSSRDLMTSQQEARKAEMPPPPSIVVAGGGAPAAPAARGGAGGDAKPALIVRNNESSLTRVTDNMIARTVS